MPLHGRVHYTLGRSVLIWTFRSLLCACYTLPKAAAGTPGTRRFETQKKVQHSRRSVFHPHITYTCCGICCCECSPAAASASVFCFLFSGLYNTLSINGTIRKQKLLIGHCIHDTFIQCICMPFLSFYSRRKLRRQKRSLSPSGFSPVITNERAEYACTNYC